MPLPDYFWDEGTPLQHERVLGRLSLEVILHRRENWPDYWGAKDIWEDRDLRDIIVSFVGRKPGDNSCLYYLIECQGYYFHNALPLHRVESVNGTYTLGRREAVTKLASNDLCKRTVATDEDLLWLFSHWRPERGRKSSFASWWRDASVRLHHGWLHRDEVNRINRLIKEVDGATA